MSDPQPHDIIQQQPTIYYEPRKDFFAQLSENATKLFGLLVLIALIGGWLIAFERKAERKEMQAIVKELKKDFKAERESDRKRILKLEREVSTMKVTIEHLRERRRR